jgi:hypothetical protein
MQTKGRFADFVAPDSNAPDTRKRETNEEPVEGQSSSKHESSCQSCQLSWALNDFCNGVTKFFSKTCLS